MAESPLPPTLPLYRCPECHTPVKANDMACETCGTNLALAAVLAERRTLAHLPHGSPKPAADLPRFGEFLILQGLITPDELRAGLARQREAAALGVSRTIGQTLVRMGCLTPDQLEQASIEQVKQLQRALDESRRQEEERVAERTAALELALRRLAELNELKANFVANISHELRTPLVPIRGYTDLLAGQILGPLTDRQRDAVDAIHRSGLRLEALINDLIQFASGVKGRLLINTTVLAMPDLTARLTEHFERRAAGLGLRLSVSVPDDLPLVQADAEKVHWAIYQLLDNAVKFTPAGGQVSLTVQAAPDRETVRVSVSDTGVGIPPERLEAAFQPFEQILTGKPVDGTGLGLALVKRIVEAHGSRVEVDSQPNAGSTFSFRLNAAPRP
jgi:two-component system cell cycle sensor histidine kinase PleC